MTGRYIITVEGDSLSKDGAIALDMIYILYYMLQFHPKLYLAEFEFKDIT